jgi:hypothetical protein
VRGGEEDRPEGLPALGPLEVVELVPDAVARAPSSSRREEGRRRGSSSSGAAARDEEERADEHPQQQRRSREGQSIPYHLLGGAGLGC